MRYLAVVVGLLPVLILTAAVVVARQRNIRMAFVLLGWALGLYAVLAIGAAVAGRL